MKSKIFQLCLLSIAVIINSCSDSSGNGNDIPKNSKFNIRITLPEQKSVTGKSNTKTTLSNDSTKQYPYTTWNEDDKITLFFVENNGNVVAGETVSILNLSEDKKSGSIEGKIPESIGENFTIYGISGMSDVKISRNTIQASVSPTSFLVNGTSLQVPTMFKTKTSRKETQQPITNIAAEYIGTINQIYLHNYSGANVTVESISLLKADDSNADWFYQNTPNQSPVLDIISGEVVMQNTSNPQTTFSPQTISHGEKIGFIQWVMQKNSSQIPNTALSVTTSKGTITTSNAAKVETSATDGTILQFITLLNKDNSLTVVDSNTITIPIDPNKETENTPKEDENEDQSSQKDEEENNDDTEDKDKGQEETDEKESEKNNEDEKGGQGGQENEKNNEDEKGGQGGQENEKNNEDETDEQSGQENQEGQNTSPTTTDLSAYYVIQTDGSIKANTFIASLKTSASEYKELEDNTFAFRGITESKWFEGLTKVVNYGNDITRLNYQYATTFAIEAPLTPRITSLRNAFRASKSATYPGIENWNTKHIKDMREIFSSASAFNQDISGWDVSGVEDMSYMFYGCTVFNQDISGWNVSSVTDMSRMFREASVFNQDISGWDVSNVESMSHMFWKAYAFNQDISGWDVSNVKDMSYMFWEASVFNQNIGKWNTKKVEKMQSMFYKASVFNQDISGWDVSNVTNMSKMFSGAKVFNQNIGKWNTQSVENMAEMFKEASVFNQDIGKWNTQKVQEMQNMFQNASVFNQDISGWDVSNVKKMGSMFGGAKAFNQNIGKWNTQSVKNMSNMFTAAIVFNQDISGWNVSNVTDMKWMFGNATAFNQDISGWDVSNVTKMNNMFSSARKFKQDLSKWCVEKIKTAPRNFNNRVYFSPEHLPKWGTCPPKNQ